MTGVQTCALPISEQEFRKIYEFIGEPYYKHEFENLKQVEVNGMGYDDTVVGENMHTIRTEVKKESTTIKKLAATLVDNQFPTNERVIKGVYGDYKSWEAHYQTYRVNGMQGNKLSGKDLSEFITFGLTNREFQKFLESIPFKTKNAWSEFVQSIRNILGLPAKSNTALSAFLQSASDVVETGAQTTRIGKTDTELIDTVDFANKSIDEKTNIIPSNFIKKSLVKTEEKTEILNDKEQKSLDEVINRIFSKI